MSATYSPEEMLNQYIADKYNTDIDHLKQTLEQFGVAVIPSVLTEVECENMKSGMWDYLEHITQNSTKKITCNDNKSWKNIRELLPLHSMLIQHWNIGHSQFIWDLRQNPNIIKPFAKIWDTDNLVVSFDGASFHMPSETTEIGWHRNLWLHTDQSYLRNDFECMQSWVTSFDVNRGDATLCFLEGSHKYHKECKERFNITDKEDWYKLDSVKMQFYIEKGCELHRIMCPKGSMVFWDSRTIHCGVEPVKGRELSNFRCVAYMCYMPRTKTTEANIRKKIKAFEELRTTNHWANKPKLFPVLPRTYGNPIPNITNINPPVLTDIGRKLVGYVVE
jgi:ectoine hydroxylase-related dioxygenase (phytanoyl-CoA dioxygenase family)